MERRIEPGLRNLPSVDAVLKTNTAAMLVERFGRNAAVSAIRTALKDARIALKSGILSAHTTEHLAQQALAKLSEEDRSSLRTLFNLTGTVLHTNLGRALLAEEAITAATEAMRNAVALEFDLTSGKRGERDDHVRSILCDLTGAEDATVVNNNAAAVLLALNTLAGGRDAIVSRGELIEIGGAFRMPDIMMRAGARLVEVGTTNRTHASDYERALKPETGVILKVHTSNYCIMGFTAEVSAGDLAAIAADANVPLMHDLGSGTLLDLTRFGLEKEPTVRDAVAHAGLVTFSGDKLLGGPQAGFIVGKRSLIQAINRNPMKRALRVDKIRLAAIEATLKLYRNPERLAERLPTLKLLARTQADIRDQVERILARTTDCVGAAFAVEICDCQSQIGSGALPLATLPSAGIRIHVKHGGGQALEKLAAAMRALDRPIVGRIEDNSLILDFRCLTDEAGFLSALSLLDRSALA
nr:L-seryl-tRNA(Sec) selenium transferase [Hyphomicrobium denitrificans]